MADNIIIDGLYASICREYRENPNPVTEVFLIYEPRFYHRNKEAVIAAMFEDVFGEFYHIDPTKIYSTRSLLYYAEIVSVKAKSRIKQHLQECLEFWIDSLQPSS